MWYFLVGFGVAMVVFIAVFAVLVLSKARRSSKTAIDETSHRLLDSYLDARYHTAPRNEAHRPGKD